MPDDLDSWLATNNFLKDVTRTPISGGCISQAFVIESQLHGSVFIKTFDQAPSRFFECEAEGLHYLGEIGSISTPAVLGYGKSFIALEFIPSGVQKADFWVSLGYQLAHLHGITRQQFGLVNDNYCGSSLQKNAYTDDGFSFFAEQRLLHQADLALKSGKLPKSDFIKLEALCAKLAELIPAQPASLLHGDLWSGNIHINQVGEPVFIDPAIYFSWAEIDLAMTQLFGGFPTQFYEAYEEVRPLEPDWKERLALYNLYPLLNHLNLFGEAYLEQIRFTLNRFT